MQSIQEFRPSMCVCTPMRALPNKDGGSHLEPITIQWHRAMKMLLSPMGYNVGEIRADGMEVGDARNIAAKEAIQRGMKYLLFIDADTLPPQNAMQLLVYHLDNNPDYDIATGLYTQKADPAVPLIWNKWGEGTYCDWTLGDVLRDGIVAAGTGCMLIRVSLFDRLPYSEDNPWFRTDFGQGHGENAEFQYEMSDDIFFCRRAVEEAGAKILVDTNVYCKHIQWRTGRMYELRDDSLPVRRLEEKLVARNSNWMTMPEREALRRLSSEVASKTERPIIIEVGSFVGQSTKVIVNGSNGRGTVYCVDTWKGTKGDATEQIASLVGGSEGLLAMFKRNMKPQIDADGVIPVVGESVPAAKKLQEIGIQADMVFVDADHERCADDIRAYLPLVKPGGIICGHDYSPSFPAVMRDVRDAFGDSIEHVDSLWIKRLECQESAA